MTCKECEKYSKGLQRCIDGRANPPASKTESIASMMGWSYICLRNNVKRSKLGMEPFIPVRERK